MFVFQAQQQNSYVKITYSSQIITFPKQCIRKLENKSKTVSETYKSMINKRESKALHNLDKPFPFKGDMKKKRACKRDTVKID